MHGIEKPDVVTSVSSAAAVSQIKSWQEGKKTEGTRLQLRGTGNFYLTQVN